MLSKKYIEFLEKITGLGIEEIKAMRPEKFREWLYKKTDWFPIWSDSQNLKNIVSYKQIECEIAGILKIDSL